MIFVMAYGKCSSRKYNLPWRAHDFKQRPL